MEVLLYIIQNLQSLLSLSSDKNWADRLLVIDVSTWLSDESPGVIEVINEAEIRFSFRLHL